MKALLTFLPLASLLTLCTAEPVVKLAGIQVVYDDGAKAFDGFKTYNREKGYGVTLMVSGTGKDIVGFDNDEAKLEMGGVAAECRFFNPGMSISKDRRTLRVEFTADAGAKFSGDGAVKITGELPVLLATGKEEARSEVFKTQAGTAVTFPASAKGGQPKLKVKSTGKPKWGDDPFEVVLSTNRKADDFAGIRFYDKDGNAVESNRGGSSWMGFGNKGSGEISFTFKKKQTELILAIESWTGREEKKLKVDLSAGLAIPE
jgi:hypothetical protein